jgi:hypothetical protein
MPLRTVATVTVFGRALLIGAAELRVPEIARFGETPHSESTGSGRDDRPPQPPLIAMTTAGGERVCLESGRPVQGLRSTT